MKAAGYCGLACCLCAENKNCVGCQDGGCDSHGWCKNYNCCREKGLNGCWECDEFPCDGGMLAKPRIRAFAKFAQRYGIDEMERCLLRNRDKGIIYHYDGGHEGDYDKYQTEEEIIYMIKTGFRFGVRPAVPEDAPKCADIHMRSWIFAYSHCVPMDIIEQRNARRPAMWTKLLENCKDIHFVVTCDDEVIGFITINPTRDEDMPDTVYELTGLYLDPDYIGKGFGKLTMDWIKREISARGYKTISLWVLDQNDRAKSFYEKSGFKADGSTKESGLGNTKEERYICELADPGVN